MKKLLFLIALLSSASLVQAQQTAYWRNDNSATAGTARNLQYSRAAVDANGRQFSLIASANSTLTVDAIPISSSANLGGIGSPLVQWIDTNNYSATTGSTTTAIQITGVGTVARVGDILLSTGGTVANIRAWSYITAIAANTATVANAFPTAPVNTDTFELLRPAPLISTPGVAGTYKASPNFQLDSGYQQNATTGLMKLEDAVHTSGDASVAVVYVTEDPLTVSQNASGDYANPKTDRTGRTITSPYAPHGELWEACGTATAVTSDVAIKASVASNRIYTTSIACKNTSTTVGPTLDFKDGSTIISVGGITATSATGTLPGEYHHEFPVPLRGTSATAFNFATNTATTSVTCCGTGFISVD